MKVLLLLLPCLFFLGCTPETLNKSDRGFQEIDSYNHEKTNLNTIESKDREQNNTSHKYSYEFEDKTNYNVYFAYDSSNDDEAIIEPVTSGKLILKNGCLLFENTELKVPVFPSEKSEWDEVNNVMILDGIKIPLHKNFKASGIEYKNPEISNFKVVAKPSCVENRKFELILGGVSF